MFISLNPAQPGDPWWGGVFLNTETTIRKFPCHCCNPASPPLLDLGGASDGVSALSPLLTLPYIAYLLQTLELQGTY